MKMKGRREGKGKKKEEDEKLFLKLREALGIWNRFSGAADCNDAPINF